MTSQVFETLIHKSSSYWIREEPLSLLLDSIEPKPDFNEETLMIDTSCWRGYTGLWAVLDMRLCLVNLRNLVGKDLLQSLFHDQPPPIQATWYSGQIRLVQNVEGKGLFICGELEFKAGALVSESHFTPVPFPIY